MKRRGIYLVQPESSQLKIIYNMKDAERAGDQSTILKVNKENIKFGQSDDFEKNISDKKIFISLKAKKEFCKSRALFFIISKQYCYTLNV